MDLLISQLNFNSVENVPGFEARAAFSTPSATVFREDVDIIPTIVNEKLSYIPWGDDNQMPFSIMRLLRKEACYCRFSPTDFNGRITHILYANWRKFVSSE